MGRPRRDPRVRLLHPVAREHPVDPGLDEDYGVFELGRPRVCADDELAVLLPLDGALLDRKIAALLAQESQTAGLVAAVGLPRFRAWVATEALAEPVGKRWGPEGRSRSMESRCTHLIADQRGRPPGHP